MTDLTREEKELLDRITLLAIENGNSVSPQPFDPTPKEYTMLHAIRIKLELNHPLRRV